jgi:hypothetical protein
VKLPGYLDKNGRKEPNSPKDNPFCYGQDGIGMPYWEIIYRNCTGIEAFQNTMASLHTKLQITGVYDFHGVEEQAALQENSVLIVDVGGGKGDSIKEICKKNPGIALSRCILQDRKEVIDLLDCAKTTVSTI